MVSKSTQVALQQRIKIVQGLLLKGYTRAHIVRHARNAWDIGDRQTDEYIQAATEEIDEINKNSAERNLSIIASNLWALFRKVKKTDLGGKRILLLDLAKLHGLDRIDINLNIDRPLKGLTDSELAKALEEG